MLANDTQPYSFSGHLLAQKKKRNEKDFYQSFLFLSAFNVPLQVPVRKARIRFRPRVVKGSGPRTGERAWGGASGGANGCVLVVLWPGFLSCKHFDVTDWKRI